MKFTGINYRTGDVQIFGVDSLPSGARKLQTMEEKIIARGEISGHCHVLTGDVELFEVEGTTYAVVGGDGAFSQHYKEANLTEETFTVNKDISNCEHKGVPMKKGVYKIGLDRQYDPNEGVWRKNQD